MKETIKTATFKVTFEARPGIEKLWKFNLIHSNAFKYGNGTTCIVTVDGEEHGFIDTRYCKNITLKFEEWCTEYLDSHLNKSLLPKWTEQPNNSSLR